MSAKDTVNAKTVFFELLDLPPEEHSSYLDNACQEDSTLRERVEALLKAHTEAGDFLGSDNEGTLLTAISGPHISDEHDQPKSIGQHTVIRTLGHGGFGTVYLCQQHQPIERQIAIKVLKAGMDSASVLRRFKDERVLLSKMNHPGIARVLDAGKTDQGQPYISMEYIDGRRITDYCDHHRLDLRARLELFAQACQAIQHAHQKGVIHRDIKPSNVLVTQVDDKPVVKVIDFGISKAIDETADEDAITRTLQLVGTPQYMSPEQASVIDTDLDTRTDVYSLGVLLYELATGYPPFDPKKLRSASIGKLERMIRDTDPQRPSLRIAKLNENDAKQIESNRHTPINAIVRQLRGELDWVIFKAMEKARDRRYSSAFAFYEDIKRILNGKVAHARPPSRRYAIGKMISRHKAWATVGGLAVVALLAVSSISLVYANRIKKANTQIQLTLKNQEDVLSFTEQMLRGIDPAIARGEDTQLFRSILDEASDRVNIELSGTPEVEVRIRLLIGELYSSLGMFDETLAQYTSASILATEQLGPLELETISARSALGTAYVELSEFDKAHAILESVYADARTSLGDDHPDTLVVLANLVSVYNYRGEHQLSVNASESLLKSRIRVLGDQHDDTMATRNHLALALRAMGENERAKDLYEHVLEHQIEHLGSDHPNTLKTRTNLAQSYQQLGLLDESIAMNEAILEQKLEVLGEGHPSVLVSMVNLAMNLQESGDQIRSLQLLTEAHDTSVETLGESHQYTVIMRNNLASYFAKNEQYEQAIVYSRLACHGLAETFGEQHPMTLKGKGNLSEILTSMEQHDEALEIAMGIFAVASEHLESTDPTLGKINERVGTCLIALHRNDQARPYLVNAQAHYERDLGPDSEQYIRVHKVLEPG